MIEKCEVMEDVLFRSGYSILEHADYDAMLLEIVRLRQVERFYADMLEEHF